MRSLCAAMLAVGIGLCSCKTAETETQNRKAASSAPAETYHYAGEDAAHLKQFERFVSASSILASATGSESGATIRTIDGKKAGFRPIGEIDVAPGRRELVIATLQEGLVIGHIYTYYTVTVDLVAGHRYQLHSHDQMLKGLKLTLNDLTTGEKVELPTDLAETMPLGF